MSFTITCDNCGASGDDIDVYAEQVYVGCSCCAATPKVVIECLKCHQKKD